MLQPSITALCPWIQDMPHLRMLRLATQDYSLDDDVNCQTLGHLFQATSALRVVYIYWGRGWPGHGLPAYVWKRGSSNATEAIWERKAWKGVYG